MVATEARASSGASSMVETSFSGDTRAPMAVTPKKAHVARTLVLVLVKSMSKSKSDSMDSVNDVGLEMTIPSSTDHIYVPTMAVLFAILSLNPNSQMQ